MFVNLHSNFLIKQYFSVSSPSSFFHFEKHCFLYDSDKVFQLESFFHTYKAL